MSDAWAQQHPGLHTVLALDRGIALGRNRVRIIGNGQGYVAGLEIEGSTRALVLSIPDTAFTEELALPEGRETLRVVRRASTLRVHGEDVEVMNHVFLNPAQAEREREQRQQRIAAARASIAEIQAQLLLAGRASLPTE